MDTIKHTTAGNNGSTFRDRCYATRLVDSAPGNERDLRVGAGHQHICYTVFYKASLFRWS